MRHASAWLLAAIVLIAALAFAPRPALATWPTIKGDNLTVCNATGSQIGPVAVSDNAGGVYVAWQDLRNLATAQIYATHVLADGTLDPGWPSNGLAVGPSTTGQGRPAVATDSQGGVYVTWMEQRSTTYDIYLQRISHDGLLYYGWSASGLLVGATTAGGGAPVNDDYPVVAADHGQGCYVAWTSENPTGSDVWATHIYGNGTTYSNWPMAVGGGAGTQAWPSIITDASGNLLIAFEDNQNTGYTSIHGKAYGDKGSVLFSGMIAGGNPSSYSQPSVAGDGQGNAIVEFYSSSGPNACLATLGVGGSSGAATVSPTGILSTGNGVPLADGSGGAFVTWVGAAVTTTIGHINDGFLPATGWTLAGLTQSSQQSAMVSDGSGGAILADLTSNNQPELHRLTATGALPTGWSTPVLLSAHYLYPYDDGNVCLVPDGSGGAIAVWADGRNAAASGIDLFAQEVDHFGAVGGNAPTIVKVRDVLGDQGGHVRVSWTPSPTDADPYYGVTEYFLFRQAPAAAAQAVARGEADALDAGQMFTRLGAKPTAQAAAVAGRRAYLAVPNGAMTYYWENVGSQYATALPGYSLVTATTSDSSSLGNPRTLFMVYAMGAHGGYWTSAPDSGYSVDNLPPVAPAPFTATFRAGTGTVLQWSPNAESDLAGYRLYKGTSQAFKPGPGNLVAQLTGTTSYIDAVTHAACYKLSAIDIHGNESAFAMVVPGGTTDVGDNGPHALAFTLASGNPMRGEATLQLALPAAAATRVAIYDAAGREVQALWNGTLPAGVHALRWNGADERGQAVASGLYFARLVLPDHEFVRRIVVAR